MTGFPKKDQAPYLVFACSKCGQYSFVKPTQKNKKCMRCGRTHNVSTLSGEIIKGVFAAREAVVQKQHQLKGTPQFISNNGFELAAPIPPKESNVREASLKKSQDPDDYSLAFRNILGVIRKEFARCPGYFILYWAEEARIPAKEVQFLMRNAVRQKILQPQKEGYFKILI